MNLPDEEFDALVRPSHDKGGSVGLPPLINIGVGEGLTIRVLAETVTRVVGHESQIILDPSKFDGTPRQHLDMSRMRALEWRVSAAMEGVLYSAYDDFQRYIGVAQ